MNDVVDYTSGPYQQFAEEPRMQELDIIQEKEEVPDSIPIMKRVINKKRRGSKRSNKKRSDKKGGYKRSDKKRSNKKRSMKNKR